MRRPSALPLTRAASHLLLLLLIILIILYRHPQPAWLMAALISLGWGNRDQHPSAVLPRNSWRWAQGGMGRMDGREGREGWKEATAAARLARLLRSLFKNR